MVIDLIVETAPKSCFNFIKLCLIKYYNNQVVFLVERDCFMQSGDPTGTGSGGESVYWILDKVKYFEDEIVFGQKFNKKGLVAMANCGSNKNGSQFFITVTNRHLDYLDGKHTMFGRVREGHNVLELINSVLVDRDKRPLEDITILDATVLVDPFSTLKHPVLGEEWYASHWDRVAKSHRISRGEVSKEKDREQLEVEERRRITQSRALTLEMLGDLPRADASPPETVLFICKLNPITSDEDLKLIFSRFGRVKACQIVRNKNGASLQYGFITFYDKQSCEEAYFRMNNVLIDDRRVRVDFSQSIPRSHK
jgi:peptidyl-prolyl cis-trans isomerase-like 4